MEMKEKIASNFDTFDPKEYLKEYYRTIDFENDQLLQFFHTCYRDILSQSTVLEFGVGPTIYSLISMAAKVETIHVCDKLVANLQEMRAWKSGEADAFNWKPFIQRVLEIEGKEHVTQADIQEREELLRRKLTRFFFCDAFNNPPLLHSSENKYDIVQVNFVPESITSSLAAWESAMCNILSLLASRGTFILTSLKHATYYHLQQKRFPAVSIDEELLTSLLIKLGFNKSNITMKTIPANIPYRGYSGMIFIKAQLFGA